MDDRATIGRIRGDQGRKRVLMLTHRAPYPPDRGDRIRAYHILKHLSQRFDVSLACVSDEPVSGEQWRVMQELTSRVALQRISPRWGKVRGLASLAVGGAVTPTYFYRPALARTIRRWHRRQPFDAVFTYCTGMIHYARKIARQPGARRSGDTRDGKGRPIVRHVIDLVDVDSAKWSDYAVHAGAPMSWIYGAEARRLKRIEAGTDDRFDAIAVVSAAEAKTYRRDVGNHPGLTVLRHAVDTDYFQPLPDADTSTLLFMGTLDYKPNVDGVCWFAENVMPTLRAHVPDVVLKIVGRRPSPSVLALGARPGVEVVGSVPDVRDHLGEATAVIAPLQIARGVQTKVLEAMAAARVAVCSVGAADGIHAKDGEHLLVADTPQRWVMQLRQVLSDAALRRRIGAAARQCVEVIYPWERCLQPLEGLLTGDTQQREVPGLITLSKAA